MYADPAPSTGSAQHLGLVVLRCPSRHENQRGLSCPSLACELPKSRDCLLLPSVSPAWQCVVQEQHPMPGHRGTVLTLPGTEPRGNVWEEPRASSSFGGRSRPRDAHWGGGSYVQEGPFTHP